MKFRSLCLGLLACAPFAAPILASDVQRTPSAPMATIVTARFKQLDKNGDGKLDAEEMSGVPWLKVLDKKGDGFVTLDEALAAFASGALEMPGTDDASPRQGPRRLKPADFGVGGLIPDLAVTDLDGREMRLSAIQQKKLLVVAIVSTSCPVSKKMLPSLAALEKEYADKGVAFLFVAPTVTDTSAELRAALSLNGVSAPCIFDRSGAVCRTLGALSTTDTFLLDGARTLVYRGALDDQYGLGYSLEAPRHRYLASALRALLDDRRPEIAATEAPGCALDLAKAEPAPAAGPTYHNRVSRIVQANCQECHRSGGIAPFPLETYAQVSAKAGMIRKMVSRELMPPWFAAPPAKGERSPWANDRSLASRDKADMLAWLEAGKPLGNPADAPIPRSWPAEWQIGTPDAVLQIPQPITVNATGTMPYQNVVVETNFAEDKWVRGFEVRPTAREVVHHVLIFVEDKAGGRPRNRQDGIAGGFFAAYVPGNNAVVYPDGIAKLLPAGSRLHFQIHYTPNGTGAQDQVRIGLLFSKEPPQHEIHVYGIANVFFKIPPGADDFAVTGAVPILKPVTVLGFMPHMHLRGKAFRFEETLPDGSTRTLLDVPRYDFNWQLAYRYADPLTVPVGARVQATGWFDNSTGNPANPDPTQVVHWGQQTTDEMMLGYVEYYFTDEINPGARISSLK